ncbi:ABC transporter ATP-binding protein [Candidatus Bipolaricaulota bacterium]|nr:ABC transporter ATP-binding protein [Candidatus Bipolaricaulota bacterium]
MLLNVSDLQTHFFTDDGVVKAADYVDLTVEKGEVLGLVGESGCGKSTVALSILRLIPKPGKIVGGRIEFLSQDLLDLSQRAMRKIRGNEISMVFQDPTASLNPVLSVGDQIGEAIRIHQNVKKRKEINARAVEILQKVGISDPRDRLANYPHELSGGMQQRVMIAIALSCQPKLLLADEPTSSLDVTIEAQILNLLRELQQDLELSMIMITHDLGVIAEISDRVTVMYAGQRVESATVTQLFENPLHPYTQALLEAIPTTEHAVTTIETIPGKVPSLVNPGKRCLFSPRCEIATEVCKSTLPESKRVEEDHIVACHHQGGPDRSGGCHEE